MFFVLTMLKVSPKNQLFKYQKQRTKFSKNVKSKLYHIENSETTGQTADLDEVAHYEPPHQDLH